MLLLLLLIVVVVVSAVLWFSDFEDLILCVSLRLLRSRTVLDSVVVMFLCGWMVSIAILCGILRRNPRLVATSVASIKINPKARVSGQRW